MKSDRIQRIANRLIQSLNRFSPSSYVRIALFAGVFFGFVNSTLAQLSCDDLATDAGWSITLNNTSPICGTGSRTLTAESTSNYLGNVSFTYVWESSPDGTTYSPILGEVIDTFITPVLAQSTFYRVTVNCNSDPIESILLDEVQVVVVPSPTAQLTTSNTNICAGQSVNLNIVVTGSAPFSGTLSSGGGAFSGNSSPISKTVTPASTATFTITSMTGNGCPAVSLTGSTTVTVIPLPTASITGNATICVGASTNLSVTLGPVGAGPWSFTVGAQNFTNINTSPFQVTVSPSSTTAFTVTNLSNGCSPGPGGVTGTANVTVNPLPTSSLTGTATICNGGSTNLTVNLGPVGAGPWSFTLGGQNFANINTTPFVTPVSPSSTTPFTVTALTAGGCPASPGGMTGTATVTVGQRPTGTIVSAVPTTLCAGSSSTISLFFTGTGPFNGTLSNGTAFSSNTTSTTVVVNPVANVTITIATLTNGTCASIPADLSGSATITVNPVPVMNSISAGPFCNGASVSNATINFGASIGGSTFQWTCNPNIGFGTSGSGDFGAWTALNTGTTPVPAVLSVTPTSPNSCPGQALAVNIVVNPTPTINTLTIGPFCNGVVVGNTPFSGSVAGSNFNWTISQKSSIGFGTSANGVTSIPSFTAAIPGGGNNPVTVNLVITPQANGCTGTSINIPVTVNPRPSMCTLPNVPAVCQGQDLPAIVFDAGFPNCTAGVDCPNCTYSWSSTTQVGYGLSGTGNLPASVANTGNSDAVVISNISVFATALGCTSASPATFQVTINPGPDLPAQNNLVFCEGESMAAVCLTSTVPGAVSSWTTTTNVGFGLSGGNCTNAGAAAVNGELPVSTLVTFNSTFQACTSTREYQVTVIPEPFATQPPNLVMCEIFDEPIPEVITLTGSNIANNYTWNTGVIEAQIGLTALQGVNTITVIPVNNTTGPISDNITVTPTLTQTILNITKTCSGPTVNFTITVNPRPVMNEPVNQSLCAGEAVNASDIPLTSNVSGAIINWQTTTLNVIGLPSNQGAGIPSFIATNSSSAQVSTTLDVWGVFTNSGVSCPGDTLDVVVSVFPQPNNTTSNFPTSICSGSDLAIALNSTTTPATTWTWTSSGAGVSGNSSCAAACDDIADILVNGSLENNATVTYVFLLALTGTSCTRSVSVPVIVHPLPPLANLAEFPATLCEGSQGVFVQGGSTMPGLSFGWSSPTPGVEVIAGGPQGNSAYINLDPGVTGNIIVNVGSQNAFGCVNGTNQVINVVPDPDLLDLELVWLNQDTEGATLVLLPFVSDYSYQWGRTPLDTWIPQEIAAQTGQSFLIGLEFNPSIFLYWVEVTNGDCVTRIFLDQPINISESSELQLNVFPNPADDVVYIAAEGVSSLVRAELWDMTGRLCLVQSLVANNSVSAIAMNQLAAGSYILRLWDESGKAFTSQLVKR